MLSQGGLGESGTQGNRQLALALLGGGALLLAVAGGFFGYQAYIGERYESVVSIAEEPQLPPRDALEDLLTPSLAAPAVEEQPEVAPPVELFESTSSILGDVYGIADVSPQAWDNPLWADDPGLLAFTTDYQPVAEIDIPESGLAPASLVRIPIIGLESETIVLDTFEFDGRLKYESPVFDVGIVPNRVNPGEVGNTWLFGHLESPLKGEGAVFRDLPKLHDHLRNGEAVYVIVDSADGSFLYQATEFRILPAEDMYFWDSDGRTATLVCSWPRFKYDERIVITTELVGARLSAGVS